MQSQIEGVAQKLYNKTRQHCFFFYLPTIPLHIQTGSTRATAIFFDLTQDFLGFYDIFNLMVTNLPEKAKAKWAEAIAARDPATKLRLLKEFYSSFSKHKGTERLEKSIKRQISSLEDEVERARSKRRGSSRLEWVVKKGELTQLAVVGTLQTATSFFNLLTKSDIKAHESLMRPILGVFKGAGVQFQLIVVPFDRRVGEGKLERFMNLARNADGMLIVLGYEPLSYTQDVIDCFESHNMDIRSDYPKVEIAQTPSGGIRIVGSSKACDEREIADFISGYKIRNAVVKITYDSTLEDVESALFGRIVKKAVFVALRGDRIDQLRSLLPDLLLLDSTLSPDKLALHILKRFDLIRIYTKVICGETASKPLLMKKGAKAIDVAEEIHKEMARFFRYARVWRGGDPKGVRVGRSFELRDGDVIEIHSS
ncbi:MAG: TGS domain-containing protein [archaeon]|nr:TGS domain-containing protein [archaeon]MCP8306130.1 TGS domain-containing protein [archaeon]